MIFACNTITVNCSKTLKLSCSISNSFFALIFVFLSLFLPSQYLSSLLIMFLVFVHGFAAEGGGMFISLRVQNCLAPPCPFPSDLMGSASCKMISLYKQDVYLPQSSASASLMNGTRFSSHSFRKKAADRRHNHFF